KAKTISRFLSRDFRVESSYGHLRDLPKSKLGIDVDNDFKPQYIIPMKSKKRVNELKKISEKAEEVVLASDEDREGEAIAWHLIQALKLDEPETKKAERKIVKRIVFHEITKKAIEEALKNPRDIDQNLVDAQQARRILDRLVGYKLSPFLWKKIYRGLSAGRVQSAAVRLIVEREQEIEKFKPDEYWTIAAKFKKNEGKRDSLSEKFEAKLAKKDGKPLEKLAIKNKQEADAVLKELENARYKVSKIESKEVRRQPFPPFTTSTLQQTSANKFGYSAKKTMFAAQRLYESGFITYMRTDSVNLSNESLESAASFIKKNIGREFVLDAPRRFKTKSKMAQEAHEAIRPADLSAAPDALKEKLQPDQYKIYNLVWKRFLACQMKEAIFDSTSAEIETGRFVFRASGSVMKFAGWTKIYETAFSESLLPLLEENEILKLEDLNAEQHFTEPPPRYSEAALIKTLEEHGIGRPSTYAPTLSTIQNRNYAEKNEQKKFKPTEIGIMVNDLLMEHFPEIVNLEFTAKMEDNLDQIADGKEKWEPVLKNFYGPFAANLKKKYETVEKRDLTEKTDELCEKCGKPMIIKHGRFGRFIACSGFPDCRTTKSLPPVSLNIKCPKCQTGEIIMKKTRKGRIFYGCSRYPDCDLAAWQKPTGRLCVECGAALVELKNSVKCSNKNCSFREGHKSSRNSL
ncbi:MAG: type I DNA topoisomerase, partial [Patescibacteria group bacterium]